jgi:hypothetical protein
MTEDQKQSLTKREFLRVTGPVVAGAIVAACAPTSIPDEETEWVPTPDTNIPVLDVFKGDGYTVNIQTEEDIFRLGLRKVEHKDTGELAILPHRKQTRADFPPEWGEIIFPRDTQMKEVIRVLDPEGVAWDDAKLEEYVQRVFFLDKVNLNMVCGRFDLDTIGCQRDQSEGLLLIDSSALQRGQEEKFGQLFAHEFFHLDANLENFRDPQPVVIPNKFNDGYYVVGNDLIPISFRFQSENGKIIDEKISQSVTSGPQESLAMLYQMIYANEKGINPDDNYRINDTSEMQSMYEHFRTWKNRKEFLLRWKNLGPDFALVELGRGVSQEFKDLQPYRRDSYWSSSEDAFYAVQWLIKTTGAASENTGKSRYINNDNYTVSDIDPNLIGMELNEENAQYFLEFAIKWEEKRKDDIKKLQEEFNK